MNNALIRSLIIATLLLIPLSGCGSGGALTDVSISNATIRPNGTPSTNPEYRKLEPETDIHYRLTRRSDVAVTLIDEHGKTYQLRQKQTRQADSYDISFDGAVAPDATSEARTVLPDGKYQVRIDVYPAGSTANAQPETSQTTDLTIVDGNTNPPKIDDLVIEKKTITPNGDGEDDETQIGYSISVSSTVSVRAVSKTDSKVYLLQEPKKQYGMNGFKFTGYEIGGNLMPDGDYYLTVKAEDTSGNVTVKSDNFKIDHGGYAMLQLLKVTVDPPVIPIGGVVTITAVIKNVGTVPVKTQGPGSGTAQSTKNTFTNIREKDAQGHDISPYYEKLGRWRLAVMWTNAGSRFPLRWGLAAGNANDLLTKYELQPNEEVTVVAPVIVEEPTEQLYFTVALERGGVGFLQETVLSPITVNQ